MNITEFLAALPDHKAGLSLDHNPHLAVCELIEEYVRERDYEDDFPPGEFQKSVDSDELWILTWYPDSSGGHCSIAASSLEAVFSSLKK